MEQSYCAKTNTRIYTYYVDDDVKYKWLLCNPIMHDPQDAYNNHQPCGTRGNSSKLCDEKCVMRFTQWNPTRAAWIAACVVNK
jgi:hypothetical protein